MNKYKEIEKEIMFLKIEYIESIVKKIKNGLKNNYNISNIEENDIYNECFLFLLERKNDINNENDLKRIVKTMYYRVSQYFIDLNNFDSDLYNERFDNYYYSKIMNSMILLFLLYKQKYINEYNLYIKYNGDLKKISYETNVNYSTIRNRYSRMYKFIRINFESWSEKDYKDAFLYILDISNNDTLSFRKDDFLNNKENIFLVLKLLNNDDLQFITEYLERGC